MIRLPRPGDDAGFTMAEMAVTIIILGVVGTMLSVWFIAGVRTNGKSVARNDDIFAARTAMQRLVQDIQMAVKDPTSTSDLRGPITAGSHNSITIYSSGDGKTNPALIKWTTTNPGTYNAALVRTYVPAVVNASTGAVTWPESTTGNPATSSSPGYQVQTVLRGVADINNANIPAIFRYLDKTGAARNQLCSDVKPPPTTTVCTSTYAVPLTSNPLSKSSPLKATDDVTKAVAVEIHLQVASAGDGVASTRAPYYETSRKSGTPVVTRNRVYPISNTLIG